MFSLLFLFGAVASLSMIVPDVDAEEEGNGVEHDPVAPPETIPPETEDQSDESTPGVNSGAGDATDDSSSETDATEAEDSSGVGETTGDTPSDGSSEGSTNDNNSEEGTAEDAVTEEQTEEDTPTEDSTEDTPPTVPTPINYDATDAVTLTLTGADGEETDYDLSEHLDYTNETSNGGVNKYRISLSDGNTLLYVINWQNVDGDDGQETVITQKFDLFLSENGDWDYREDGFKINLSDENGDVIDDKTHDIDRLITGDGQNRVVSDGSLELVTSPDGSADRFTFHYDGVDLPDDPAATAPTGNTESDDGTDDAPYVPRTIYPSEQFVQETFQNSYSPQDQVIIEIDPETEGHVHLMKVSTEEIRYDNSLGFPVQYGEYQTVHYIVQTDSETPPDLDDLNVQRSGAANPAQGVNILGAFTVDSGINNGLWLESDTTYVTPEYFGKQFSSVTDYA